MDPHKNTNLTPEEQNAEQEMLAEAKEDEIREKIVSELGLSDDNSDLIDKLVQRELDNRKKLSTAVRQKIDWRTKASQTNPPKQDSGKTDDKNQQYMTPEEVQRAAEAATEARLEQRDLDEMDYPDEIKEEIKKFARQNNVSVRKAEQDQYIKYVIGEHQKQQRINEAADNGSRRRKTGITYDTSKPLNPQDFDFSTEEGRAEWEAAKTARRNSGK
jgi:hypothetical protein